MNVLQMSISAAILILVIVVIRSLAFYKLPKKTFLVLWGVALFRLLIPFYIPLPIGITAPEAGSPIIGLLPSIPGIYDFSALVSEATPGGALQTSPVMIVWIVGMIVLALFFIVTHLRRRREYKQALPVENDFIKAWLQSSKLMWTVKIQQSDRINAPMTYGIFKPVILFPKTTDWQDTAGLQYVLTHELTHIKRFDILSKWLFAAALCVHWFNPLVWVMYILANRDIEVACDETVVLTFGETKKSAYALTLMGLEESRSGFAPLINNFAKNAIKERINAIMKLKRKSVVSVAFAFLLVSVLAVGTMVVFAANDNGYREFDPNEIRCESLRLDIITKRTEDRRLEIIPSETDIDDYTFNIYDEKHENVTQDNE